MTDDLPGPSVDARGRTLSTISDQLEGLMTRVADDVARYADAKVGPTGGGFVIYYLTDDSGEPLKTSNAGDQGISLAGLERHEHGRAAGRERGGQYVEISVDADK